ncbi:PREDICTED: methyl farnesoate epoxidase-like [Polistes canadensis]|uniref:methyl farnesoate epoxidase-like n=1 Tax=Polistes canadensis TaxID=91411 RepID=UPI000718CFB7|nr:PREDICTED: methyl farnesoate epoxidase-like [Polistes canadensis]
MIDRKRSENLPPGPRGLPIIGNMLDVKSLLKKIQFHVRVWCYLAEIYGPVVHLKLIFGQSLIIVSGRNAIVEMLSRNEFDGRPNNFEIRLRTRGERRGLIFNDGDVWSEHRRFTVKTLKHLGFDKTNMEDMILDDTVSLLKMIEKLADKKGPITEIYDLVSIAVIASFWFLITGSNCTFFVRFQLDQENPKLKEVIALMKENVKGYNTAGRIINYLPFLRYIFPNLTGYTQIQERHNRMWLYFKKMIRIHDETKIQNEPTNLIDIYLNEMKMRCTNLSSPSCFNDENLIALIRDLFVASIETTTNTIGFVIAFLSVKQDIQKKIHDELDDVLGKDILPRLANRNRLPYLQATLAEVARMGNVGPTSVPHRAINDATLLGYNIKKDSIMLANFMSVHMDENHWGDPNVFRPERFINENGEYCDDPWIMTFGLGIRIYYAIIIFINVSPYYTFIFFVYLLIIIFSFCCTGRRRCPGEILAKNILFLVTACMLQKFYFAIAPGYPEPNLLGIDGFTISPPPINLVIKKRI